MSFLTRTITVGVKGKKKNPISLRVKGAHILSVIFLSAFLIAVAQPAELSGAFYDDSAAGSMIDSASPTRYKDNCRKTYPNPRIRFDHQDSEGRVYIPVVNWSAYANEMFRQAPDLPPCGANPNSARTWVDIYDADTNKRIYGFCALGTNEDLKGIWFLSKAKSGRVYIILIDRACKKKYRSNTLRWGGGQGNCDRKYPRPRIKFDHRDSDGRVYIPVINWSAYPNALFQLTTSLPPCGANPNASRTWVDIYDAATNKRIYGFCALDSNDDLKGIWFHSKARSGRVYIILTDRLCKKKYRSNTIKWP